MIIQINLPEHLNKMLKIYKATNCLGNLQESVIDILNQKYKKLNEVDGDELQREN